MKVTRYLHPHPQIFEEITGCCYSKFGGIFYEQSHEIKQITSQFIDRQKYLLPVILPFAESETTTSVFDIFEKHTLIAGMSGSGKTTLTMNIALNIFFFNHPSYLKVIFLDGKCGGFNKDLGKIVDMIIYMDSIYKALLFLDKEMTFRKKILEKRGQQNVLDNNISGNKIIPYYIIFVDEWEEIVKYFKGEKREKIQDIAARITCIGRSLGFFLIVSTQTPYVRKVGGELKNNMLIKICGRINHSGVKSTAITKADIFDVMELQCGEFILQTYEGRRKIKNIPMSNIQISNIVNRLQKNGYIFKNLRYKGG